MLAELSWSLCNGAQPLTTPGAPELREVGGSLSLGNSTLEDFRSLYWFLLFLLKHVWL